MNEKPELPQATRDPPGVHGHILTDDAKAVTVKGVTVTTVTLLGGESRNINEEHAFGLAPDHVTTTPVGLDGRRLVDVGWGPGEIGYLPPGLLFDSVVLEPSRTTYVRVPDEIFRSAAYESVDASKLDLRWLGNIDDPVSQSLMKTMALATENRALDAWPLIMESLGTALSVSVMRHLGAPPILRNVPYEDGLPDARLARVIEYMETNIGNTMTLAELAGVAGLSSFHFNRTFRKSMNISPVRYLWRRRVQRAKDALSKTMTPLAIIAYECGFSSQSHFTTMFKRDTGATPLQYRAQFTGRVTAALSTLAIMVGEFLEFIMPAAALA